MLSVYVTHFPRCQLYQNHLITLLPQGMPSWPQRCFSGPIACSSLLVDMWSVPQVTRVCWPPTTSAHYNACVDTLNLPYLFCPLLFGLVPPKPKLTFRCRLYTCMLACACSQAKWQHLFYLHAARKSFVCTHTLPLSGYAITIYIWLALLGSYITIFCFRMV